MASIAKPTDGATTTSTDESLKRIPQMSSAMQSSYDMLKRDRNNAYPAARNRDEYVKKFGEDDPMLKFNDSMANMSDEEIEQRKAQWQDMADKAAAELERRQKLKVIKGHKSLNPNIINGVQNNGVD